MSTANLMLKSQRRFFISFVWIFFLNEKKNWAGGSSCGSSWLSLLQLCVRVLVFSGTGVSILHQEQPSQEAFLPSPDCTRKENAIILQMKVSIHPEIFELTHTYNSFPSMLTSLNSIPPSQNYENNGRPKGEAAAWKKNAISQRNTGTIFTFFSFTYRPHALVNILICSFFWWKLFREKKPSCFPPTFPDMIFTEETPLWPLPSLTFYTLVTMTPGWAELCGLPWSSSITTIKKTPISESLN